MLYQSLELFSSNPFVVLIYSEKMVCRSESKNNTETQKVTYLLLHFVVTVSEKKKQWTLLISWNYCHYLRTFQKEWQLNIKTYLQYMLLLTFETWVMILSWKNSNRNERSVFPKFGIHQIFLKYKCWINLFYLINKNI